MSPIFVSFLIAQSGTSVESFLKEYDAAVVANDPDWSLNHTEPTAILRLPTLVTYREIAAHAKWLKANRPPSVVAQSTTTPGAIRIVGDRAIFDFTTVIRYKPGTMHDERWRGHAILVLRGTTWRIWRLDETADRTFPAP